MLHIDRTTKDGGLSTAELKVLASITEADWLALANELVVCGQPESGNPLDPDMPSGSEEYIAQRIARELEALGFMVELDAVAPGRPNVIGRLPSPSSGPSIILNTHLDTYPAIDHEKWTKTGGDPFNPTRWGDWLYGRGTSDTRGNMASTLIAARALVTSGVKLRGTLMCVYTVNEEKNGPNGSMYLTQEKGLKADAIIIAEPTAWGGESEEWGMALSVANSGHCLVEITIDGTKSHIWRPDVANNPIGKMAEVLLALSRMAFSYDRTLLSGHTPPMFSPVRLTAGLKGEMQFSPDRSVCHGAVVGIVPGMTIESILADLNTEIERGLEGSAFQGRARQVPGSLFVSGTQPLDPHEQPCSSIRAAYMKLFGVEPIFNRKNAFNDTIRFREAGIPAVTIGPGEDSWAPDNEKISITKAVTAAKLYALAVMKFLGVEEN